MEKGKDALHTPPELVCRTGGRLRAPRGISFRNGAQIVHLYNDWVPKRAFVIRRVRVLVCAYFKAAPTGVPEIRCGTE